VVFEVWTIRANHKPESLRMIHFSQVSQFVDDHVIQNFGWREPPSSERWISGLNQPLVCDKYSRFGLAGEPLR